MCVYCWISFLRFIEDEGKVVLLIISLLGFILFDVVYVMAVFNYAAQSEMNINLLYAIKAMTEQKLTPDLEAAMKVWV